METVDAQAEFAKLCFDIAGDPEPVAPDMLRTVADDSHIVYGSDFLHSPVVQNRLVVRSCLFGVSNPPSLGSSVLRLSHISREVFL